MACSNRNGFSSYSFSPFDVGKELLNNRLMAGG
jgi:hypothetical protein